MTYTLPSGKEYPLAGMAEGAVHALLVEYGVADTIHASAVAHLGAVRDAGLLHYGGLPPVGALVFFVPPDAGPDGMVAVMGADGLAYGAWGHVWEGKPLPWRSYVGWCAVRPTVPGCDAAPPREGETDGA